MAQRPCLGWRMWAARGVLLIEGFFAGRTSRLSVVCAACTIPPSSPLGPLSDTLDSTGGGGLAFPDQLGRRPRPRRFAPIGPATRQPLAAWEVTPPGCDHRDPRVSRYRRLVSATVEMVARCRHHGVRSSARCRNEAPVFARSPADRAGGGRSPRTPVIAARRVTVGADPGGRRGAPRPLRGGHARAPRHDRAPGRGRGMSRTRSGRRPVRGTASLGTRRHRMGVPTHRHLDVA